MLRTAIIILIFIAQFAEIRDTRKVIDMPRGHADYNAPTYATSTHDVDIGKLLAFLNGFVPLDTRGRPFYYNSFIDNIRDLSIGTSTGSSWTLSAEAGRVFGNGAAINFALQPGTKFGTISINFLMSLVGKIGIETAYGLINSDIMPHLRLFAGNAEGTNKWGEVRGLASTGQWQYYDASGNWQNIDGAFITADNLFWGRAKLVIDLDKEEYTRFIAGGKEFDLSGIPMRDFTGVTSPYKQTAQLLGQGETSPTGGNISFGYFLVTVDEP
jgi:hypothetical protein